MKKLMVTALVLVSSIAFADGAGTGAEEVIAAGGLTTVVGGCANAVVINNGENSEIVYTGPCNSQAPKATSAYVSSCASPVLMKRFPTAQQAGAHCLAFSNPVNQHLQIGVTYDWGYKAYTCSCYENNQNGGN